MLERFRRFWNIFFNDRAGVWTALFTGVLSVFTYMLYRVSNSTDETQRSAQRAFLNFNGPVLGPKIVDNGGHWTGQEFALQWTNSGNTPARDLVIQTNNLPFRPDIPKEYDFPLATEKTSTVIGPKGTYGTGMVIPKESLADAWHSKGRLFIWGTVIYKDAFPQDPDRLTEFCVELTHLTMNTPKPQTPTQTTIDDPKATLVGFQWQTCRTHNCYDEDCKDYKDRVGDMR
jgi:hypothetical protein